MADCYIVRRGGTGGDTEEKIDLLQYIDLVSKGISGTSYQGGSVYVLGESSKMWSAFQFKTNYIANIQVADLCLSRIEGFYVNKFRIFQGASFYTVQTQNNEKGFVVPSFKGVYQGTWFGISEILRIVHKSQTSPIKIAPALNKIWNMDGKEIKISLPLKLKFNDYFALTNVGNVTGIFALWWGNSYQFLFMVNNRFPVFDYTNDKIVYGDGTGDTYKFIALDKYINKTDTYVDSIITVALPNASQDQYISGLKNGIDLSKVYFNSEDILDEKGNVILAKNCDISDFL